MKRLAVAAAMCVFLVVATSAVAEIRIFTLTGVTFADGGTATGTIDYDTAALKPTSWSIVIAGGDTATFPPVTLVPSNSTVSVYIMSCGSTQQTMGFQLSDGSQRQFRITPTAPLATATGNVPLDLATCGGGSGGVECYNCAPFRLINAGELDYAPLGAIPMLDIHGMTILAGLLVAAGVMLLVRRRLA